MLGGGKTTTNPAKNVYDTSGEPMKVLLNGRLQNYINVKNQITNQGMILVNTKEAKNLILSKNQYKNLNIKQNFLIPYKVFLEANEMKIFNIQLNKQLYKLSKLKKANSQINSIGELIKCVKTFLDKMEKINNKNKTDTNKTSVDLAQNLLKELEDLMRNLQPVSNNNNITNKQLAIIRPTNGSNVNGTGNNKKLAIRPNGGNNNGTGTRESRMERTN